MIIISVFDFAKYMIESIVNFRNDLMMTFIYFFVLSFVIWCFRSLCHI